MPDNVKAAKEGILDYNEAVSLFGKIYQAKLEKSEPCLVVLKNTTENYVIHTAPVHPRDTCITEETKIDLEEFNKIFGSH